MSQGGYSSYDVRVRAVEAVVCRGLAVGDVAQAYRTDRTTLFRWMKRYKEQGENGLHRQAGSGRPRKLKEVESTRLWNLVLQPATSFGYETDLWTVARVHQVVQDRLKVVISKDTIWRRLREAGLTYQKPERQYYETDDKARQEWVELRLPTIRETVRKFRAILYFQDEANISLTAFLGKTWAPRGKTPKAQVTGKRGGVAALSAISRRGHLLFALYEKRIASDEVIHFLAQMLHHHRSRHLVVLMDNAPPHVSKKTMSFIESQPRLHVFNFPSYSPDWNPDEKVWNHLKHQELKSHIAKTKAELKELTDRKLNGMANNPHLVRGLFFRCCVADLFG
jgi:transposase